MKFFFLLLCLAPAIAYAGEYRATKQAWAPAQIFRFFQSSNAVVGRPLQIYAQGQQNFLPQQELMPEFQLNGTPVVVNRVSPSLWILSVGLINEVNANNLVVANIFTRDIREKARVQGEIRENEAAISAIEAALENETDPEKIAELQAQLAAKQQVAAQLQDELANLKVFLQSESYTYASVADPANPDYPFASGVNPSTGVASGGTTIQISGERFPTTGTDPIVKVGGVECAFVSRSVTLVEAVTPAGMPAGVKDVEIIFPGTPQKNALLTNAFTVTNP